MLSSAALFLVLAAVRIDVAPPPPAGRVIVEFARGASFEQLRRDVARLDRRAGKRSLDPIRHEYRHAMSGAALDVPVETVEALRRLPYVRGVYPDLPVRAFGTGTAAAGARVHALSLGTRGEGIVVAVIDSGVDYTHEALGQGFGPGFKVAGGWDFHNGDPDPMDDMGHGTHVAGIIAGDSAELTGVAPGATLYAYKVLNRDGAGSQSDIIAAIDRSIDPNQDGDPSDRVDVVNLSLGAPGTADDPVSRAVDRATAAGVIVVVAAGNDGAPLSVRSPGLARTAITVGAVDDAGAIAPFSSRGPGAALLSFKPDVVAPGVGVLSARVGGGLIRNSGTSMAAPYVAGVAALLAELHPDWTPADIRSALVTTAVPNADPPAVRGAGHVHAERAASMQTLLDSSGLSFGLAPGVTGMWEQRRVVTVTNRAAVARTIDVAAVSGPAGTTVTASPARLQLTPGASQAVELTLRIDNTALDFPDDPALSGVIGFRGEEPFDLPWIVMRAARLTVSYDMFTSHFVAVSADGVVKEPGTYDWYNGELFGRPGTTWDIFSPGVEPGDDLGARVRIAIARDQPMAGDGTVALTGASASAELVLDARDETGRWLRDVERDRGGTNRWLALNFEHPSGKLVTFHLGSWERIFLSPMPWVLHPFQMSWDDRQHRVYNAQHPTLHGVTESKTLTIAPSDYIHTIINFDLEGEGPHALTYCTVMGVRENGILELRVPLGFCFGNTVTEPPRVHYYTTNGSADAASGFALWLAGETYVPALRGVDGAIVASDVEISPADYRIANGEEMTVGNTALFPLAFPGTTGAVRHQKVLPGFYGPAGEWNPRATRGTSWTLYDAAGVLKDSGPIENTMGLDGRPGDRLVLAREGLKVGELAARGELEVRFGPSEGDLAAPTLTSLRVENAQGRIADRLTSGSSAMLRFSAADHDHWNDLSTRSMRPEATRVWYRRSGVGAWQPLPVSFTDAEDGSWATLRHVPAGDLYRADLSAATATIGAVDLRIEVEDAGGNRTSWTQAPAFVVEKGNGKRRSVR